MFFICGSCRIIESLGQQFYFGKPIQFAHIKIVLLNPRRAWFQQHGQLCRSAHREIVLRNELSENVRTFYYSMAICWWFLMLCLAFLIPRHSLKCQIPLSKIHMNQSFAFSHKALSFSKIIASKTRVPFYLFTESHSLRTPYSFPNIFMWVHHGVLLFPCFERLRTY